MSKLQKEFETRLPLVTFICVTDVILTVLTQENEFLILPIMISGIAVIIYLLGTLFPTKSKGKWY